ncbi:MAG: GtrA family protein [Eubacteriales bacterium]|nr:GtrA family protein [Eubacteriales bacterium]
MNSEISPESSQSMLKWIQSFYHKHKQELLSYLVFGLMTTVVNVGVFNLLYVLDVKYQLANLAALILAKLFAYFTNKHFVFKTKTRQGFDSIREFIRFVFARGFTGLVDYFGLIVLVEVLALSPVYSKYGLQIVVIVLNYILGKKLVFTSK